MTKKDLLNSIKVDLGANYYDSHNALVEQLLDEVINDALFISNRKYKVDSNNPSTLYAQLDILNSEIRRCVKTLYLQRGAEDVASQSMSGLSSSFENAKDRLRDDIIKNGKRIMA